MGDVHSFIDVPSGCNQNWYSHERKKVIYKTMDDPIFPSKTKGMAVFWITIVPSCDVIQRLLCAGFSELRRREWLPGGRNPGATGSVTATGKYR